MKVVDYLGLTPHTPTQAEKDLFNRLRKRFASVSIKPILPSKVPSAYMTREERVEELEDKFDRASMLGDEELINTIEAKIKRLKNMTDEEYENTPRHRR